MAGGSFPAVSALGVRWRLGRPGRRALAAVVAAAGLNGEARPLRRMRAGRAARLRRGQAAWLWGGRVAVARAAGGVVVVAAAVARVAVAGRAVWVGPGETAVLPAPPGPARVEAAGPPRCAPVLARRDRLADALLDAPGVNLAVTPTTAGGWTDAVVVAAGGDFVCPCGARFASIGAINDHYAVRLIGDHYAPMLPEAPGQRPAGVYTPRLAAAKRRRI